MAATPPTTRRQPLQTSPPRGPDAVREALIEAASTLFAERGPGNVSIRAIARAANVNHGLVHHYFGSKDALLRAVLDHLSSEAAAEIAGVGDPTLVARAGGATERHGRILAHLLLEARNPAEVQTDHPALQSLIRQLRAMGLTEREARERAALVASLVMGWQLFEPFLVRAAGLDRSARTRAEALDAGVKRLLAR